MIWFDELVQDVRYGARTLLKRPGYATLAVFTLGLGIGANTAIFSVINGVLLKPLPYGHGDRLAVVRQSAPLTGQAQMGVAVAEYYDYRAQAKVFDGLVEYHQMNFDLLNRGEPDRVDAGVVSHNFFDLLGIAPILGRSFVKADDEPGAEAVLILSYRYWRQKFGADRDDCRAHIRDERPAASCHRRPAQCAALSAGERRLHARAGVPLPRRGRTEHGAEQARIRGAQRLRTPRLRRLLRAGRLGRFHGEPAVCRRNSRACIASPARASRPRLSSSGAR